MTLLVSRSPSVINDIRQLHDGLEFARLEVCGRLEKVLPRLGRDNTLLLVHVCPETDAERVRAVLAAVANRPQLKVVLLSSHPASACAFPSQLEAHPVYHLPADLYALQGLIEAVHADALRRAESDTPAAAAALDAGTAALLGPDLNDQFGRIHRVAGQSTTILLTGETGSGKSMLARLIHSASPRRDEPYLVVDCGALSGQLIESEMFGHVRGSFTGAERERQGKFAAAGVGTLVLDEINSLPLTLQAKLLRAVEEKVFEPVGSNKSEPLKARLIAVSNVALEDEVKRERFRADLFYRLNVVEFRLPPLRERPGAIVPLAQQFVRASATAACHGVTTLAPRALQAMLAYHWPGNVRELRNVIERAAALAAGPVIDLADLPDHIAARVSAPACHGLDLPPVVIVPSAVPDPTDEGGEAARIVSALRRHKNNRRRAAAELGMSRMSLYKKLHKYGLFTRKGSVASAPAGHQ
jgi:DNA-binding NtrC family response regulator